MAALAHTPPRGSRLLAGGVGCLLLLSATGLALQLYARHAVLGPGATIAFARAGLGLLSTLLLLAGLFELRRSAIDARWPESTLRRTKLALGALTLGLALTLLSAIVVFGGAAAPSRWRVLAAAAGLAHLVALVWLARVAVDRLGEHARRRAEFAIALLVAGTLSSWLSQFVGYGVGETTHAALAMLPTVLSMGGDTMLLILMLQLAGLRQR